MLGGVEKLTIAPLKKPMTSESATPDVDTSAAFTCQFNPESFTLSKGHEWKPRKDQGKNNPDMISSGGCAGSTSLTLMFDTTDTGDDVRELYARLLKMQKVQPSSNKDKKGQPKQVQVQWGTIISYISVIQHISENYQLFAEDGTPLRAQVTVDLSQVWDMTSRGGTNPTSRSEARRTWTVERGQRLDWIAYQVYGLSTAWRHIAETNGLDDPHAIRPGQILKLVSLP